MKFAPVLELLRERAGLDPASLGATAVRAAVTVRLRACGLAQIPDYVARLASDPGEFQVLLDEVVVPETWFFRGGPLFYHLAELVRQNHSQYRVLSLPCSTGEEPYSLAIALCESGLPLSSCVIDGVDISPKNVRLAQAGVYPELSFRQTDPAIRARHFRTVAGGWQISDALRAAVRFQVGNLLDPALLLFERPYDLVFCRNLFIYLTPVARQQALVALARLVTPGGLLCLGHAEPLSPDETRFTRTNPDGYFLYRRTLPNTSRVPALVERRPLAPTLPRINSPVAPIAPPRENLADLLAQAQRHADGGNLALALVLCNTAQERFGPTAELYTLIGIIHQARRDRDQATQAFRKALYLEPDRRDALVHLMLLYQEQGDQTQAALLRKRLERLAPVPGEPT